MKLRMKAIDVVTILSEVSRAKKRRIYARYGINQSVKKAIEQACRQGRWRLV
jgi:hypothetical protein